MSRIKNEPELMKSDLMELYSRSLLALTDLMAIAADKGFDIEIRIDDKGSIDFRTWESTPEQMHYKSYKMTTGSVEYSEKEYKRVG